MAEDGQAQGRIRVLGVARGYLAIEIFRDLKMAESVSLSGGLEKVRSQRTLPLASKDESEEAGSARRLDPAVIWPVETIINPRIR